MNKKTVFQIVLLVALIGFGIYLARGYFAPAKMEIVCTIHPPRPMRVRADSPQAKRRAQEQNHPNIAFGFNGKYELKEVKVVPLDQFTTNKYTLPVWHMISESNSAPTKVIIYGQWIRGMHPALKGARPEPLETNVTYRLFVATASTEGQCDFKLNAMPETAAR